ncbi:hypothetical protein [Caballeronia sp. J97]|uniref:hypothetical protein n=1 Tax=Caballeronia sp. J97 TaxID=2805429 RepID=UPI002AAFD91A|nr:hypothetical protein [Caballeronia sp. J97]
MPVLYVPIVTLTDQLVGQPLCSAEHRCYYLRFHLGPKRVNCLAGSAFFCFPRTLFQVLHQRSTLRTNIPKLGPPLFDFCSAEYGAREKRSSDVGASFRADPEAASSLADGIDHTDGSAIADFVMSSFWG